ncbi:MAG TPA: tetratricopeptide repeat protein [Armatimonadota bacterium]|nr:tetratricopeptide repeat protein [Armatimonadota bacterium]
MLRLRILLPVIITGMFFSVGLPAQAGMDGTAWKRYDVNKDNKFDDTDKRIIFKAGNWSPSLDVNGDGKKDMRDAYALLLLQSTWDRSADLVIDASDFTPLPPISLPNADATAAFALVTKCEQELLGKVPADLDAKLQQEWQPLQVVTAPDKAALYEESGMVALTNKNLDVAEWAYAKACRLAPSRDSAYANLGFTLAQRGRYRDAMILLAYARQLDPHSGTTSNNIAWIFARNGQLPEAKQYYKEAIKELPDIAQYHLNLGIVLLRTDEKAAARAEFDKAAKLCPNDRDALFMAVAVNPATPSDMAEYKKEYEREREEYNKDCSDDERNNQSWDQLSNEEKIQNMLGQITEQVYAERTAALKALEDETKVKIVKAIDPIKPQWKSARADFQRWNAGAEGCYQQLVQITADAQVRADEIATTYARKEGAAILTADQQVLQLALAQAQIDMASYTDGAQARKAFSETIDRLYTEEMNNAQKRMATATDTASLDLSPEYKDCMFFCVAGFMPITAAAVSNAEYGKDLDKGGDLTEKNFNVKFKMQPLDEPGFGLSLGLVGVEWNSASNEFKLQVGQGVIAAGTWSPSSGFGFQLGVGISAKEGVFKVKAGSFIKWGSDGSITVDYKGGANVGAGPLSMGWGDGVAVPIRAASNEPIGALGG